jgi:hypothetical protein
MRIESDGHSQGNPRLYELIEHAPKTGKSPTIWAWPEIIDYLKVAGQPVPGPWPPHQERRPDPEEDSLPVAIAEPDPAAIPTSERRPDPDETTTAERPTVAGEPTTAEPAAEAPGAAAAGPPNPALGGSEAADEAGTWVHPESSLREHPPGHDQS